MFLDWPPFQIFDMSVLDYKPIKGETFSFPSETVPNQAIPVKDIYRRYKAGTLPPIARHPFYDKNCTPDDALGIDVDLVDKQEAFERAHSIRMQLAQQRKNAKVKADLEARKKAEEAQRSEASKPD